MTINVSECPHCETKVNHSVRSKNLPSKDNPIELQCPRCKEVFSITSVSQRTLDTINENKKAETDDESESYHFEQVLGDDNGAAVEDAIGRASEAFVEAAASMGELPVDDSVTVDAESLVQEFSLDNIASSLQSSVAQKAASKVAEKLEWDDGTEQIVQQLANEALRQGMDRFQTRYRNHH